VDEQDEGEIHSVPGGGRGTRIDFHHRIRAIR
jgi:hypothetical protein